MNSLSEKEVTAIGELLAGEAALVKKFQVLADVAEDSAVKQQLTDISAKHQTHFNKLYEQLN